MNTPLCPVTGEPALRLVQYVSARFLTDMWRLVFKTDARGSFGDVKRFGLWESPTGLYFFDPPTEGDNEFYLQLYRRLDLQRLFKVVRDRSEFRLAARWISDGDKVLDVGCGFGQFRAFAPQALYTGLDPNFGDAAPADDIRKESIEAHLLTSAASYDAVCSFQVLEHVARPRDFFAKLIAAARPGGCIIVGVPHVPSAFTRLPNYMINAPPHHLTWWTKPALAALAERAGLDVESIETVPWGRHDSILYWMERCTLVRCGDQHYRHSWLWHACTAASFLLGAAANTILGCPKTKDEGGGLLLVSRKPS